MKNKVTKNKVKKPIFKKWWFWVIIVIVLAAIFGDSGTNDGTKNRANDASNSTEQQATTSSDKIVETEQTNISSDKFIEDVKTVIHDAISSEDEEITDVTLKNEDLHITVDLSNADPAPLTIEDLALSRTSSITDSILTLTDYDSLWNTITVDFGDIGKVICDKDSIKINEIGGRYFPSDNFILE